MRFFTNQHKYYCGIDLHANWMYVCVADLEGNICVHKNIRTNPETFLALIAPYRDGLVVGVECVFCWYWLADLCAAEKIEFVLGHALYTRMIRVNVRVEDLRDLRPGCRRNLYVLVVKVCVRVHDTELSVARATEHVRSAARLRYE